MILDCVLLVRWLCIGKGGGSILRDALNLCARVATVWWEEVWREEGGPDSEGECMSVGDGSSNSNLQSK